MSKYAGSPGRSIRSEKTCGCGAQRSPEIALTPSTCSEPSSNSTLFTSATQSFSRKPGRIARTTRSEEHTSELQSRRDLVCRLLLEKKKKKKIQKKTQNNTKQST